MLERSGWTDAAVAVLPYGTRVNPRLAETPLDDLNWPLGRPERLARGTVADLGPQDHLLCYVSSRLLYMPRPRIRALVSVIAIEPSPVHRRNMRWLRVLHGRFHRILTHNKTLLAAVPNGERHLFGSTWVPDWQDIDTTKTRQASLIASAKTYYDGHKLRHRVAAWARDHDCDIDLLGHGYRSFDRKSDGLASYRYSVVIENVREESYLTEKLIDCLLCDTVPIYWGAPDIGTVFDIRGMIPCESFEDMTAALSQMSDADYAKRLEFVRQNKEKAARFADHEANAARLVLHTARSASARLEGNP